MVGTAFMAFFVQRGTPESRSQVELRALAEPAFPDAVRPGVLWWACSQDPYELADYFRERKLPFVQALVRRTDQRSCHIYYEPTLRGFRASPEDASVAELFASVNTLSFLAKRNDTVGDGLDVLKTILPAVPRPLRVTLAVGGGVPDEHYRNALAYHFPATKHTFGRYEIPYGDYDPWMQDVLKAGYVGSAARVLVTRHAYEGDKTMGTDMRGMLSSLHDERTVRSNLSWEGGDLQFALDPRDRRKLLLFHGTTAKRYWGTELTAAEFAYVLQVEFGADTTVYLRDATPHVDYGMSVLPSHRIALVADLVCNNSQLARTALDVLLETYATHRPPALREIDERWGAPDRVREWIHKAWQTEAGWATTANQTVLAKVSTSLAAVCPQDLSACLHGGGLDRLLTRNAPVLQAWVTGQTRVAAQRHLARRMLAVMDEQLSSCNEAVRTRLNANALELQKRGFKVLRVPYVAAGDWAGINYVNAFEVDGALFVPRFDFGIVEQAWINKLARDLPNSYRVVPVPARAVLLANGGVHCVMAIGRYPLPRM
jgi:hypothetical protein